MESKTHPDDLEDSVYLSDTVFIDARSTVLGDLSNEEKERIFIKLIYTDSLRDDETKTSSIRKVELTNNLRAEFKSLWIRRKVPPTITREIRRGDPKEIFSLFDRMPRDEEFAKLLDEIIEKMRREMKLG